MRNLIILCQLTILSLSYSTRGDVPKKNFTVFVTVDSTLCVPEQHIYLYYFRHNECNIEDSAQVSAGCNTICLQGYVPEQEGVSLLFERQGPGTVNMVATPGDKREMNNRKKEASLLSKDMAKENLNINGRYALWNLQVSNQDNAPVVLPLSTGKYILLDSLITR